MAKVCLYKNIKQRITFINKTILELEGYNNNDIITSTLIYTFK